MDKLNQWLTLGANLAVVAGIVFLAVELHQNTEAIQAQTRDSITEKQMEFSGWIGTSAEVGGLYRRGFDGGYADLDPDERVTFQFLLHGIIREWENSHYQYERGLFTSDEFQARAARWERNMKNSVGYRDVWGSVGETFSPSFRAEIDRIVAEVERAR
jgi:hypothetical protein